jgi:tetratricopeptide (TPR) repeat protein
MARASARAPQTAEALIAHAQALESAGQPDAAERAFRRALAAAPDRADLLRHLGGINFRLNRPELARRFYERSIAAEPATPTWLDLAGACLSLGDTAAAAHACRAAAALSPHAAQPLLDLGWVLLAQREFAAAETALRAALERDPTLYAARRNIGPALYAQGRLEQAVAATTAALRHRPDDALSWRNLATAQRALADFPAAEASLRAAIRHAPDFAEAHRDLGQVLLLQGRTDEGLAEHEWRLRASPSGADKLPGPRWTGAPLRGTLLLHFEQGFGDTLQFLRFVPAAAARAGQAVLCVRPPLVRLAEGLAPNLRVVPHGAKLPRADATAHLMSLPITGIAAAAPPYLHVPQARRAWWQARDWGAGARVGIVWAGRPEHEEDARRSLDPALLAPLLQIPGLSWFALQPGVPLPPGVNPLPGPVTDFADTAAALAALDLVVTVDTAAAHLAGAIGVPVWTLLAFVPDWRWGLDRSRTDWYPGMRLYRQPARGDWPSVIAAVAHDLLDWRDGTPEGGQTR